MNTIDKIKEIKLKKLIDNDELIDLLASKSVKIDRNLLHNNLISAPLVNHLILTYLPDFIDYPKEKTEIFYSRYYWLSLFKGNYEKIIGADAALDQQLFKLCEEAEQEDLNVDWELVENIEKAANIETK